MIQHPEYRNAFIAGQNACRAGEAVTANPHRPRRVHVLDEPPGPKQVALARLWLRGWQSAKRGNRPRTV
jgi:hypothetical protein